MQIVDYGREFHVHIPFGAFFKRNVEAIKALPERRWNPEKKVWWVPGQLREQVEQLKYSHRAEIVVPEDLRPEQTGEIEEFPDLTIQLPLQETVQLRPYQEKGIARSMQLGRVLNGDEQGLGKTLQSIATIVGLNSFPCIVVCPASTKLNWKREVEKFTHKRAMVLDSSMSAHQKKNWHQYVISGLADFVIVNYESLSTFCVEYFPNEKTKSGKRKPWHSRDVVLRQSMSLFKSGICDESHRTKEDSTNQSKFILRIFQNLEHRILLSGTPIVNKPKNLYPQLAILGVLSPVFGGKKAFLNRYCEGGNGANNLKELNYLLNKHCFFRREKKDVAKDLPEKFRQTIICDITTRREYDTAVRDLATWLSSQGYTQGEIDSRLRGEVLTKIGALKQISARGKLNEVKEFIEEVLDAGEKLIVFCNLYEIVDALRSLFPNSVTVTGRDNTEQKQANIDAFQRKPDCQLIICNIKAAGVGITLTASSRVAFVEYPWTYADCVQCEDRAHRIGQVNNVTCTYFLGHNTIDEDMYELIQAKRHVANAVTGATDTMDMEEINKVFSNLFKKQ